MFKVKTNGLLIIFFTLLVVASLVINNFFSVTTSKLAHLAGKKLEVKLQQCSAGAQLLVNSGLSGDVTGLYNYFDEDKIGLYLYKNDSLVFWNNAHIPVESELLEFKKTEGLVKLKSGYYLAKKIVTGDKKAVALCLLKPRYDLQNNYLKNDFKTWTGLGGEDIELNEKTGTQNDVELNGQKLFSIDAGENVHFNESTRNICDVIFLVGFAGLLLSLLYFVRRKNNYAAFAISITPVLIVKMLMWLARPELFSHTFLYDVQLFGNSQAKFNEYLADVVFNSIALLYLSVAFYLKLGNVKTKTEKLIQLGLLFFLEFIIIAQFNHSVKSLVANSTLSFDFLSIFDLKIATLIAVLSLIFNSLALFVVLYRICNFFNRRTLKDVFVFVALNLLVCFLTGLISPLDNSYQSFWPALFSLVLYLLMKFQFQRFSLGLGVQILIMSAITAGFLNYYIEKNQAQYLGVISDKLSERKDSGLESEFIEAEKKVSHDEKIKNLINLLPFTEKEIKLLIKQKFFSGYFNRYNIDFTIFDKDCKPLVMPDQPVLQNEGFFEDQIKFYSDSTFSPELFFVEKYKKNSRYIGKIKLEDKNLYILLEPKQFEELGSFPDLLLDQSQQKSEKLKKFSHAVYRAGQNTSRFGDLNYPYYLSDSATLSNSYPGYLHHYFRPDDATEIIISEKAKNWEYFFTYNSYLFLFFSVVSFLCYYLYAAFFTQNFKNPSLTRRIQTIIIALLLLAMTAVGVTSGTLVSKQFETDNVKQLQEKTQTIINELNDEFTQEELFTNSQKEIVNIKLKELAHLFNSDISLFDVNGLLYNTSQPRLYDKGLAAGLANPKAYFSLKQNKVSAFYDTERAGTLKYLSLYTPLYDSKNRLTGFMNLPYFAKQSDLVNELSGIISTLINVYVILFVISILSGLILASYITKPLRLIKQQIANITLGKQNETIKWKSTDEVGKLVFEYNNMLLKLEHSANLLAQSERESAWREMAKQVAHEIKNPLTPMKLNLQYLQHLMKSSPEDFNDRFEKASSSIIEQIDALANIATEFSNFAKLPGTQLQELNLVDIIQSSVNLFEKESDCKINMQLGKGDIWVMGDKEQALRVFNNVLKNAIQATAEVEKPAITISALEEGKRYIISISDNGHGIPEQMKERIFEPNFTTKSTGSGLGLAMVKSIITNFGGNIWFVSEKENGTTFFLEFVKAAKD